VRARRARTSSRGRGERHGRQVLAPSWKDGRCTGALYGCAAHGCVQALQRRLRASGLPRDPGLGQGTALDLLAGLNDRLIRVLAGLHEAPCAVAEATVQLLPFGSRAGLEAAELATLERDENGQDFLRLKPAAYAAMAQAAARADGTADAVVEWERRLERAHRANVSRPRC
jgi:hypothetical protein